MGLIYIERERERYTSRYIIYVARFGPPPIYIDVYIYIYVYMCGIVMHC